MIYLRNPQQGPAAVLHALDLVMRSLLRLSHHRLVHHGNDRHLEYLRMNNKGGIYLRNSQQRSLCKVT